MPQFVMPGGIGPIVNAPGAGDALAASVNAQVAQLGQFLASIESIATRKSELAAMKAEAALERERMKNESARQQHNFNLQMKQAEASNSAVLAQMKADAAAADQRSKLRIAEIQESRDLAKHQHAERMAALDANRKAADARAKREADDERARLTVEASLAGKRLVWNPDGSFTLKEPGPGSPEGIASRQKAEGQAMAPMIAALADIEEGMDSIWPSTNAEALRALEAQIALAQRSGAPNDAIKAAVLAKLSDEFSDIGNSANRKTVERILASLGPGVSGPDNVTANALSDAEVEQALGGFAVPGNQQLTRGTLPAGYVLPEIGSGVVETEDTVSGSLPPGVMDTILRQR